MTNQPDNDILCEYMNRLRSALEGLPAGEREDAYRELAGHVEALIDRAIATGGDSDKIVFAALRKFGDPEKVGGQLVSDYWADVFEHQRVARPKRSWKDFLLPWLVVLYAILSIEFARALHLAGFPLVCAAVVFGSMIGIATGWRWCHLARFEAEKPKKNRVHIGPFQFEPVRIVSHAAVWLVVLILAVILWRADVFTMTGLSSTERQQIENEYSFIAIMILCNLVVGKVTQKVFLRKAKQTVVSGAE